MVNSPTRPTRRLEALTRLYQISVGQSTRLGPGLVSSGPIRPSVRNIINRTIGEET